MLVEGLNVRIGYLHIGVTERFCICLHCSAQTSALFCVRNKTLKISFIILIIFVIRVTLHSSLFYNFNLLQLNVLNNCFRKRIVIRMLSNVEAIWKVYTWHIHVS